MVNYTTITKYVFKMEVYLQKELKEKTGQLIFLTLVLIIPNLFVKTVAILFLSASLLAYDIKHKNAEILYLLPFSKRTLSVQSCFSDPHSYCYISNQPDIFGIRYFIQTGICFKQLNPVIFNFRIYNAVLRPGEGWIWMGIIYNHFRCSTWRVGFLQYQFPQF